MLNYKEIGEKVFIAIEYSKTSPISQKNRKEMDSMESWKGATKYKTWKSFLKNNLTVFIDSNKNEMYRIASYGHPIKKGLFMDVVEYIYLPYTATAEEIGHAVIDAFQVAEEYHANMEKEQQIQEQEKK